MFKYSNAFSLWGFKYSSVFKSFIEHCIPGPVWEIEDIGHGFVWSSHVSKAQRNGSALCHEDTRQTKGLQKRLYFFFYKCFNVSCLSEDLFTRLFCGSGNSKTKRITEYNYSGILLKPDVSSRGIVDEFKRGWGLRYFPHKDVWKTC